MSISNERGTVVVLVAVMLFLIFFCVALVVDVGHIHNVKIELQRAADAAALAGAQQIPDGNIVASAMAMGSANKVDHDAVIITDVKVGWWDETITKGETAFDRFITPPPVGTPINAVKVTATRNVPHFFFFPVDAAEVTADAVAVAKTINPVLPLAVISCIPTDDLTEHPGAAPKMTVCDIRSFVFNQENTGAWTSLTLNVNANQVTDLMTTDEGRESFNKIIYGRGLGDDNEGIENTDVDPLASTYNSTYPGCRPEDYNIGCGLGKIAEKDIARPDEFPEPSNLTDLVLNADGVYQPTTFDPLTDYGNNGALPRWYNMDGTGSDATLQRNDHFARLWSQDGLLLRGKDENKINPTDPDPYYLRLQSYYDGTVRPFGDDRFVNKPPPNNVFNLIKEENGGIYKPNFANVTKYAGYPKVFVFNGVSSTLAAFLGLDDVAEGTTLNCSDDDALPAGQQAVVLKTPVIFAGACEDWEALSLGGTRHELYYIGMAKFLMTRAWKNPKSYDCGSNFVNVGSCSTAFAPPPAGVLMSAVNHNSPGTIEGLTVNPTADGEEDHASLITIFLVE